MSRSLLSALPDSDSHTLEGAYAAIEKVINDVSTYVEQWLKYQSLWDLQADTLYEKMGNDLQRWRDTLVEIKFVHSHIYSCTILFLGKHDQRLTRLTQVKQLGR